jgi:alpha-tubulin suppressor-like RCC1 family protein
LNAAGCWGSRAVGQIGAPPLAGYEVSPEKWPLDSASKPVSGVFKVALLAAGAEHACVRFELPSVNPAALTCWGNNTRGQTGSSTAGPGLAARIAGFDATSVTALAAGGRNTCVLDASQVKCIGGNELGQLGTGAVDADPHNVFSSVKLPPSATSIAVGANHACAVLGTGPGGSGQVACWGHNLAGQLGDGLDLDVGYPASPGPAGYVRATPVRVLAPQ